jgi:DNA repair protein RadC
LPVSLARNYGTNTAPAHSPIIFSVPPCAKPGQKPGGGFNYFLIFKSLVMKPSINQTKLNAVEEVSLIYRSRIRAADRPKITNSKSAFELLLANWDMDTIDLQEHFKVLFINRAGGVIGMYELSRGGMAATVVDNKLLFAAALKCVALSLVLAHNHPSGNTKPSKADELLTAQIKQGATLLGMQLLDHLIITSEGYLSFADEGLL